MEKEMIKGDIISIISGKLCARIPKVDIEYVEQKGRKVIVSAYGREYAFYNHIDDIVKSLDDQDVYRSLKSLAINFNKVRSIENGRIIFESGAYYGMGRNNFIKTRQAFKQYLLNFPPYIGKYVEEEK